MRRRSAIAATLVVVCAATPAQSTSIAERTIRVSIGINGTDANGPSAHPAISGKGGLVAFDSAATNLTIDPNGSVRDVFASDVEGRRTRLVSQNVDGGGANGESSRPRISEDAARITFQSAASDLVAGDANGHTDVFLSATTDPIQRVSVAADGGDANGDSTEPDISADGKRIAFTSAASNLVDADTNGLPDVFVRDLATGKTQLVSHGLNGLAADGPSNSPSISPDGRYVSFFSTGGNLIASDSNGLGDVFLADTETGRVERVSVSSHGAEQNRSVIAPFTQLSDVSEGGRYVTFDSDANNLVPGDLNNDTDVFLRDRKHHKTLRLSVDPFLREGDNDSFFPTISANGRFVAFASFAGNLAPGDPPKQDFFVYDLHRFAATLLDVGDNGRRRGPEHVRQILQRPALSADGHRGAFTTTSGGLDGSDRNGLEDVFIRRLDAPRARILAGPAKFSSNHRPLLRLGADDPAANRWLCSVDLHRFPCTRKRLMPPMPAGKHILRVRAGGPGMEFQGAPVVRHFRIS